MEHFGVKLIKRKYSLYMNREEFALIDTKPSLPMFKYLLQMSVYTDDTYTEYKKEWCEEYRKLCLQNYDLNMKYFSLLDSSDFNNAITIFNKTHSGFKKINNLFDFDGASGYYIMILDMYKQAYIGKSNNIKRRIQQHWSCTKSFDRTLQPMYAVKTSCFSIDFFRALDTTRIYVWERSLSEEVERKLIDDFPKIYLTNRIGGDITSGIEALLTLNKRNLE